MISGQQPSNDRDTGSVAKSLNILKATHYITIQNTSADEHRNDLQKVSHAEQEHATDRIRRKEVCLFQGTESTKQ